MSAPALWGNAVALIKPPEDVIGQHAQTGSVLHADHTPVPLLDSGPGKTKAGRLRVYLRDEHPHVGATLLAVLPLHVRSQDRIRSG